MEKMDKDDKLKRLRDMFYKAFNNAQDAREKAATDIMFYFVTQWDGDFLDDSTLPYKGEFNMLKQAGRDIMSDLAENPVQVDFDPIDPDRDDAAELADGYYRTGDNDNASIEAYENGKVEAVVCGNGAWEMYEEYESLRSGKRHQVIKRRPCFEANSTVFWDPNAKLLDKSDAKYVCKLTPYSEEAYKSFVSDITGEDVDDITPASFATPEFKAFSWYCTSSETYYVVEIYEVEKTKTKILTMADPFGDETQLRESDLKDIMDDMLDEGFTIEAEKTIEENRVMKYIISGSDEILWGGRIAGQYLPIIQLYGEHAFVNGQEHWEGIVRLAKDPSRLRNATLSYLADIVFRSPRPKPIFLPEQIGRHAAMYEDGAKYPYLLQEAKSAAGEPLPMGPVGMMPEQNVPQSLITLIDATRQAVGDVANPGVAQDVADPDMSGKAIYAIQNKIEKQTAIYQLHFKHAKRWDAKVWASKAAEILDVPRTITVTKPDGSRVKKEVMQIITDKETGEQRTINDLSNTEFEVYAKIGPAYASQKEQTVERLTMLLQGMNPTSPMYEALQYKVLEMMPGVESGDIRKASRKRLIMMGITEPETDEEIAMLQAEQQKEPEQGADMVLAQAELLKGQAEQMREQRELAEGQAEIQLKIRSIDIEAFKAQTARMEAEIKSQETDAKITKTDIESFGIHIDNKIKAGQAQMAQ